MKCCNIIFSPTGGTQRVTDALIDALGSQENVINLLDRTVDFSMCEAKGDIAIISVPSYAGRVPAIAAERLKMIKGNGMKAILLCVYGNRAYEDTLVEMQDLAKDAGFVVVGAMAAIAEHSIIRQFAKGRPDVDDIAVIKEMASRVIQKLNESNESEPMLPGNRPYKKTGSLGIIPKADKSCTSCGACAKECPVGAIPPQIPSETDSKKCISCMRCVSVCPKNSRKVNKMMLAVASKAMQKKCSDRKEYELYL